MRVNCQRFTIVPIPSLLSFLSTCTTCANLSASFPSRVPVLALLQAIETNGSSYVTTGLPSSPLQARCCEAVGVISEPLCVVSKDLCTTHTVTSTAGWRVQVFQERGSQEFCGSCWPWCWRTLVRHDYAFRIDRRLHRSRTKRATRRPVAGRRRVLQTTHRPVEDRRLNKRR